VLRAARIGRAFSFLARAVERTAVAARDRRARVGYIGWTGHGNLGDEAMLVAARRLLPELRLLEYGGAYLETRLERGGWSGRRYFDAFVLGGGTLVHADYLEVCRLAVASGRPLFVFGTGVGSPGVNAPERPVSGDWAGTLAACAGIGVRGPLSLAALGELGIGGSVIGDLALSGSGAASASAAGAAPRTLLVHALRAQERGEEELFARVRARLARVSELLRQQGWSVRGIALADADIGPTHEATGGRAEVVPLDVHRLAEAEALFASATVTVGLRLHGGVLSCRSGTPPVMLAYRRKVLDFAASMGLEEQTCALEASAEEIATRVLEAASKGETLRRGIAERAAGFARLQRDFAGGVLAAARAVRAPARRAG
jgi:polysaccharide pyruvyl transferase WcaK-like protein